MHGQQGFDNEVAITDYPGDPHLGNRHFNHATKRFGYSQSGKALPAMARSFRISAFIAALAIALVAEPSRAQASLLAYIGECVPFARAASGIQIFGDAWTWWDKAEGHYRRGYAPREGAVIVFAQSPRLPRGHVAVVSRIVDGRVLMITHANWSRMGGERGHVEQDVTLTDVSEAGDWSAVRVWYRDNEGLGTSAYPVAGFIYGNADGSAAPARPAPELSGQRPDYVGALIDAYAPSHGGAAIRR